ncbi:MAG: protein kinase domain-containing protein, partial [Gemmataceae bacterium]
MSDATLPPGGQDQDLLFGVLALQLDFVSAADLQLALQAWYADRSRPLAELLHHRGAIGKARLALVERLADEYLRGHAGDASAALAAACAARPAPLDLAALTAPATRGDLPTLSSEPGTLPGELFPPMPHADSAPPRRFRVVRPHARGALGEVFLAIDEQLHREVALKEMQAPYARSTESRARFLLEAEVTGQLEHPGIVPIYGLEAHPDGRPYYAMRFIRGETLHDAVERFHLADQVRREPSERLLSLRGLLGRFVAVCNAIAYAHSRGILHRDIKPGNIMLGPYGETLVVDWGLAKALGRADREDSMEIPILPTSASPTATSVGVVVGTPAFMSPEQAGGKHDALGPPSDVYALGATLYAILTGEPPFQGEQVSEILGKVKRQEFVPPRRKNPTVPPALEAVVLTAMAADPIDRYAGANELAEDVERWLADEPVTAYPEPLPKRATRWAKRHRMLVSGAAALLLTAVVGLVIGMWLLGRAHEETARQRDAAKAHLALARKAVDDCFVLATTEPVMQQERMREARQMLLEKALPFYEGFRSSRPDDAGVQADEARYLFRVAFIMNEVGKLQEARDIYDKAREAYAALDARAPDGGHKGPLGATWNNLGNVCLQLEQRDAARNAYDEALALRKPLAEANPEDPDAQLNLIATVNNLNVVAMLDGDP